MTVIPQTNRPSPQQFVQLLPHVVKLFPKAPPGRVLDNLDEFVAQTMDGGDWPSVIAVNQILGNEAFQRVLRLDVPNVFDVDSWFFWHEYYGIKPTNPNPRLRIKNFQKFKGPRNFSDQNKVGTHGEQEIRKAYGPTLSTLKPQDFKSDMYLKNIRQHAEIKADG